jgi:hypothetical protein
MTQHLIDTPAVLANCSRCGQHTITATAGGIAVVADVSPLSLPQEIAARIAGAATFDFVTAGHSVFLEWRSVTHIRAARVHPVVAAHPCAGARQSPVTLPAASQEVPDDPPF